MLETQLGVVAKAWLRRCGCEGVVAKVWLLRCGPTGLYQLRMDWHVLYPQPHPASLKPSMP